MNRTPLGILLLAIAGFTLACSTTPTSPTPSRIKAGARALNYCVDSLGDSLSISGYTTQGGRC